MSLIRKIDEMIDSNESEERAKKRQHIKKNDQTFNEMMLEITFHARLIWNRDGYIARTSQSEDRDFREYFGCSCQVVADLWTILVRNDIVPFNGSINKMLWCLFFLKKYPTEAVLANTLKVERKLLRETVWSFIETIPLIQSEVVSTKQFKTILCSISNYDFLILRLFLRTGKKVTLEMIV